MKIEESTVRLFKKANQSKNIDKANSVRSWLFLFSGLKFSKNPHKSNAFPAFSIYCHHNRLRDFRINISLKSVISFLFISNQ